MSGNTSSSNKKRVRLADNDFNPALGSQSNPPPAKLRFTRNPRTGRLDVTGIPGTQSVASLHRSDNTPSSSKSTSWGPKIKLARDSRSGGYVGEGIPGPPIPSIVVIDVTPPPDVVSTTEQANNQSIVNSSRDTRKPDIANKKTHTNAELNSSASVCVRIVVVDGSISRGELLTRIRGLHATTFQDLLTEFNAQPLNHQRVQCYDARFRSIELAHAAVQDLETWGIGGLDAKVTIVP